jgi:hypothetical protein
MIHGTIFGPGDVKLSKPEHGRFTMEVVDMIACVLSRDGSEHRMLVGVTKNLDEIFIPVSSFCTNADVSAAIVEDPPKRGAVFDDQVLVSETYMAEKNPEAHKAFARHRERLLNLIMENMPTGGEA